MSLAALVSTAAVIGGAAPHASAGSTDTASTSGALLGVAAVSATDAWAVGYTGVFPARKELILHFTGTTWQRVTGVGATAGQLTAVSASSANNVWAVGYSQNTKTERQTALILHWNGHSWKRTTSIHNASFSGINAVSATDAWAVGSIGSGAPEPLFLHWNGTTWSQTPHAMLPDSGAASVAATSATKAWAVGEDLATQALPVLYRWNGTTWKATASPINGVYDWLASITAISTNNVFAVSYNTSGAKSYRTQVMHWNGSTWKVSPLPTEAKGYLYGLNSVSTATHGDAWAVGTATKGATVSETYILHWNGKAWTRTPSPTVDGGVTLQGVAATSATNAWAVGTSTSYPTTKTVILHWDGKAWTSQSATSNAASVSPKQRLCDHHKYFEVNKAARRGRAAVLSGHLAKHVCGPVAQGFDPVKATSTVALRAKTIVRVFTTPLDAGSFKTITPAAFPAYLKQDNKSALPEDTYRLYGPAKKPTKIVEQFIS